MVQVRMPSDKWLYKYGILENFKANIISRPNDLLSRSHDLISRSDDLISRGNELINKNSMSLSGFRT